MPHPSTACVSDRGIGPSRRVSVWCMDSPPQILGGGIPSNSGFGIASARGGGPTAVRGVVRAPREASTIRAGEPGGGGGLRSDLGHSLLA
jgi:hypothetical protein